MIVALILLTGITVSAKGINLNILDSSNNCSAIFGDVNTEGTVMYILYHNVFIPIKVLVPIILIIFTTIDFAKVVFTDEKDALEKAKKNLFKRIIIGVIIFFVPNILQLIFGLFDNIQIRSCMNKFN